MSRPTNKEIRRRVRHERDRRGWVNPGHLRYGMCLWSCQELMAWAGTTHVQPSAIAFWNWVKHSEHAHRKPRVGDLVFWSGGRYGHVAVYMGRGKIMSSDVFGSTTHRVGPFTAPATRWGQVYAGAWTPPALRGRSPKARRAARKRAQKHPGRR